MYKDDIDIRIKKDGVKLCDLKRTNYKRLKEALEEVDLKLR